MQNFKKAEILSPAGNKDMLVAAVRCGADAVYLGSKEFSARRNAQNFSYEELREAVEYCHIRGVRVYLTLNILIKENELVRAFELAKYAYNAGIDGIIIQDLGLARILRDKIPDLKLHSSTQMSVHSPSSLPLLKELGFCQVVAAREMSGQELCVFCEKAEELGITVEAFVHGALCMSVSGQCLLSAFLGSRSGNRGLCAGPCRLPFKVKNGTGYDLSLKDLSLLDRIGELYKCGVRSFKIEGRMKRPEYVAAATTACRQALDCGSVSAEISDTLKNVFSRSGFTSGYFDGNTGRDMFGIRTKEDVISSDKTFPMIHELYRFERKNIKIDINAEILKGKPISVTLCDGQSTVTATGKIPQSAQSRAADKESVQKSLMKLGDTPYSLRKIDVLLDDGLYISAGELNAVRREAVSLLDRSRKEVTHAKCDAEFDVPEEKNLNNKTPKLLIRLENISQFPEDTAGIDAAVIPFEEAPESVHRMNVPVIVDIPRGMVNEEYVADRLRRFKEAGAEAAFCGNLAHISLAEKAGLKPLGDQGLNISNSESLKVLADWGIEAAIISCEEKLSDITALCTDIKKGIIAYGNIPIMLFRNCPLKNGASCAECDRKGFITDRMGVRFPVRCRGGYSEMLNSRPIWLADRLEELIGLDFIMLYFTMETPERVKYVIDAYKNGTCADTEYTRGLYYRGTI